MRYGDKTTTKSPEYAAWYGMIRRCKSRDSKDSQYYADRGVVVAPEWRDDFLAFLAHVGPRPSPRHSIDRFPNNNGNYEPGNVRWATPSEQSNNKRNNYALTFRGETKNLAEWSLATGISMRLLWARLNRLGWSVDDTLGTPTKPATTPAMKAEVARRHALGEKDRVVAEALGVCTRTIYMIRRELGLVRARPKRPRTRP